MEKVVRGLLVILAGIGLMWIGLRQPEPAGSYIALAGLIVCGVGVWYVGVYTFFMGAAFLVFLWMLEIAAEHVGWLPKFSVDEPGYYGNGDFIRPMFLALVLGIGVFALLNWRSSKKEKEH